MNTRYLIGLCVGALWLVGVSAAFGAWSLAAIGTAPAWITLGTAGVLVAGLLTYGTHLIRRAARLPIEPEGPRQRSIRFWFWTIFALEMIACMAVSQWAATHHRVLRIPALNLFIVGLHFFPLAALFRVPRYHLLGVLYCVLSLACLVGFTTTSRIGNALSLSVVPSLACGTVAVLFACANLFEVRRSLAVAVTPGR